MVAAGAPGGENVGAAPWSVDQPGQVVGGTRPTSFIKKKGREGVIDLAERAN
jgi:hypothetical protein